jgi:[ribosomal protein S18]-alanine N-acetyltransferase
MILIRPFTQADLDHIVAIAATSPEAASWSREAYRGILAAENQLLCRVAELKGVPAGFICFRVVSDEAEVLNLAVIPEARRQGLASRLLEEALREVAQQGAHRVFLEVRESNVPAIAFYARFGFSSSARRRGYYADPPDDALILSRELALS